MFTRNWLSHTSYRYQHVVIKSLFRSNPYSLFFPSFLFWLLRFWMIVTLICSSWWMVHHFSFFFLQVCFKHFVKNKSFSINFIGGNKSYCPKTFEGQHIFTVYTNKYIYLWILNFKLFELWLYWLKELHYYYYNITDVYAASVHVNRKKMGNWENR